MNATTFFLKIDEFMDLSKNPLDKIKFKEVKKIYEKHIQSLVEEEDQLAYYDSMQGIQMITIPMGVTVVIKRAPEEKIVAASTVELKNGAGYKEIQFGEQNDGKAVLYADTITGKILAYDADTE